MSKSHINLWANFVMNEKLDPKTLSEKDVLVLMTICEALAADGPPKITMHPDKINSRRLLCRKAIEMGIDLTKMKRGRMKMAMGRGLLDVWNEEYGKKFGGTLGTSGAAEITRRSIVTAAAKRREQEIEAAIIESTQKKPATEAEMKAALLKIMAMKPDMPIEYLANRIGWTVVEIKRVINGKA